MSNQKSGLRFRIPSWFAPSSASSSQTQPQKSSNKSSSIPPPTTQTNNSSSAAAKQQVLPLDEVQSRNKSRTGTTPPASTAAQKTPFKPPRKDSQNSNSRSQTSKTKADSPPQARRTSQASPRKEASPTKLNTQSSTPLPLSSQPKATPVLPTPSTPPQRLPVSKVTSPSRSKPKNGSDHEPESADEGVLKSPRPIKSPKSVTQIPKSEPTNGGELKQADEMVSKPTSPKESSQSRTKGSSRLPSTTAQLNSAIDGEAVAVKSSAQENTRSKEIPRQLKEQLPTIQGDSESPIPTQGAISSNMNDERGEIAESRLEPEVAKKVEETKDAEEEKEKNVINELRRDGSSGLNSESIELQRETKKSVSESKRPRHDDSNGESSQAHRGEELPLIKIGRGDEVDSRAIRVITLAGENRGATMEIVRDEGIPINRGYRVKRDDETKPDKQKAVRDDEYASEMYMNSNIQSINNSIMLNSSITQRDPGVHVVRSNNMTEVEVEA